MIRLVYCGCLAAVLFFSLSVSAQKNFRDGYVILKTGDTLRGQIDYREWGANPKSIDFQGIDSKSTSYTAAELNRFHVENEDYVSDTVTIYPYSTQPEIVTSDDYQPTPYQRTVFFRVVLPGKLTLYAYKDSTGQEYFFTSRPEDRGLKQLRLVGTLIVQEDGRKRFLLQEAYKDQLSLMMQDCPAVKKQIYRTPYEEDALRKLYFAYSYCNQDTVQKRTEADRGSVHLYPLLGYIHSKVTLHSSNPDYAGADAPAYNGVAGGIGLLFTLPRNREQFGFRLDGLFHHLGSRSPVYQQNIFNNAAINLDYNALNFDVQFRWAYPGGRVRPFVQIGGGTSVVFSNHSTLTNYNTVSDAVTTEPFLPDNRRTVMPLWLGGVGIIAGPLMVEARYEGSQGISESINVSSPTTSFYLVLGYRL